MRDEREGSVGRLLRNIRSVFMGRPTADGGAATDRAAENQADSSAARNATAPESAQPTANQLIDEGLRQRQRAGTAAARPWFEQAARLEPNSHVPWFMLGNVASELGDLDTAVDHYARARDLRPSDHVIHYNLGLNHLWRGYVDTAIDELSVACNLAPSYLQAVSSRMMAMLHSDRSSPEDVDMVLREWSARFCKEHPASAPAFAYSRGDDERPLRIGYVSGDFRTHSVAHFFEPILSCRDRASFTYILYSNAPPDPVTGRLRGYADDWREVWQMQDDALVDLIRKDRIDILVDLSGHSLYNRLAVFARRAAPVQITYLGYPASTGLQTMDYRITDSVTDPPSPADAWHYERLLRMPDTQWCFRPFGAPLPVEPLPARKAGFITFGSFNSLTKVSDTVLNCWAGILQRVPNSRLLLTRVRSPRRADDIVDMLEESGVDRSRIDCRSLADNPPYGLQFEGVDIALDPFPYNGVTTTCESLHAGVPVVSMHGRNCVSRSGLSLLRALGLGGLVASDSDGYVEIAAALAGDLQRLEGLRASLRSRLEQSTLRDEKRFTANFETLLRTAWREHGERSLTPPSVADR